MDHFDYRDRRLHAEGVALADIAERVGTPFYCYSTATMERHYQVFAGSFADLAVLVCFAVKANSNIAVLATLARLGAGADVVSGGEIKRALAAGVPASRIVFSGIGKTADEMTAALAAGIAQINVESENELDKLSEIAAAREARIPIAVRVNPDVDAHTHDKIATGRAVDKFGLDPARARALYARAAAMPGIEVQGLAVHIGSQITDLEPFREAYGCLRELTLELRGEGFEVRSLDLGGGLGIPYGMGTPPSPAEYGKMVVSVLGDLGCHLTLEPGRVIVGNAGVLVTRVIYVKEVASRGFVVVDAAMNDLMRPVLYDAYHDIVPIIEPPPDAERREMDVVGPVCETGDTFATLRPLPAAGPGDLLAVRSAGAYGAVMSSLYNARSLVPEVLVKGDSFAVVRQRITVDDMLARESLPDWID